MPTLSETLGTLRNTKSTRIWFMVGLVVLIIILWWMKIIKTGFAIGLGILLLAAIGIETLNYDLDLGKLWQTGDIQASRVSHTKDGLTLFGSCAIPKNGEGDLNCANFQTQEEAQAKYEQCANEIAANNAGVDANKVKSLDIYRLDGDKDGVVCEALPKATIETPATNTGTETTTKTSGTKTTTTKSKTTTTSTTKTPTYSTTPLLRTSNPYPISPATIRTNPQTLPAQ